MSLSGGSKLTVSEELLTEGSRLLSAKCTSINAYATAISESQDASCEAATSVKTYWWRWPVLLLTCCNIAMLNTNWISFGSISDVSACYYRTSTFWINSLSMSYMLSYVVLIGPAAWCLDKLGLRFTFVIGSASVALGSWIRVAGSDWRYYWVVLVGQLVTSISNVLEWTAVSLFSSVWFSSSGRASSTALTAAISPQLGIVLAFFIAPLVVHSDDTDLVCSGNSSSDLIRANWEVTISHQMFYYLTGQAVVATILFLITLLVFPDAPPSAPSVSRGLVSSMHRERVSILSWLPEIIKNGRFIILAIITSTCLAVQGSVLTLLDEIVLPYYPDHEKDVGYMGAASQLTAIVLALVVGKLLDLTKWFYSSTLLLMFLSTVFTAAYTLIIHYQLRIVFVYVSVSLSMGVVTSFFAVAYEYAVELTYPLPEGTSAGLMNMLSQVMSIIYIVALGAIIKANHITLCNWLLAGSMLLAAILSLFLWTNLRRVKLERSVKKKH